MRRPWITGVAALAGMAALGASRPAQADEPAGVALRGLIGLGSTGGVQIQSQGRLRADLSLSAMLPLPLDWFTAALVVRVAGSPRAFLGLRGGYQLEYDGGDPAGFSGSRVAHALDASLVGRAESLAGSALEAQLGVEGVFRAEPTAAFDDASLPVASVGLRAAVSGELALSTQVALLAEAELRTGAHLLEIRWLPSAGIGARYRF